MTLVHVFLAALLLLCSFSSAAAQQNYFRNATELRAAVTEYLADPASESGVAVQYGYPIGTWCVGAVDNLQGLFQDATTFNEDLSDWDTSLVTSMQSMFSGCAQFNQPLNSWNVSSVQAMGDLFQGCASFNQPLDGWDTSRVTDMNELFAGAVAFDQDLDSWDTSGVTDFARMFQGVVTFNMPLPSWNVSAGEKFTRMFEGATAFNQDISGWTLQSDAAIDFMFSGATAFSQDLCAWGENSLSASSSATLAFENTACPFNAEDNSTPDFDLNPPGPFCFGCGSVSVTTSPAAAPVVECLVTSSNTELCAQHLAQLGAKIECDCYNFCNGQLLSCCDGSGGNSTTDSNSSSCVLECPNQEEAVTGCKDSDRSPVAALSPTTTMPTSSTGNVFSATVKVLLLQLSAVLLFMYAL
jgi:surface protein